MTIIKYRNKLVRKDMASFVAGLMNNNRTFEHYMPNDGDDSFWTVDDGNDWKVKFNSDCPNEMEIIHRYNKLKAIENLAGWIAYRTGGEVKNITS